MVDCNGIVVSPFKPGDSCFIARRGSGKLTPGCDCVIAVSILPVDALPDVGKVSSRVSCLEFCNRDGMTVVAWTSNCSLSLLFCTAFNSSIDFDSGMGSDWVRNSVELDCEVVLCEVAKAGVLTVDDPSSSGLCSCAFDIDGGTDSGFELAASFDSVGFISVSLEATSPFELVFVP